VSFATLTIDLVARLANLEEGFTKAQHLAATNAERMAKSFEKVTDAAKTIGESLVAALSVRELVAFVDSTIEAQAAMWDLSVQTQLTVEEIGGIAYAAKFAGGSLEGTAQAMAKFNVSIGKAADGVAPFSTAFDAMGISVRDGSDNLKNAGTLLVEIANKFVGYADGPRKAELANALFGRGYTQVIGVLNEGGASLEEATALWEKYSGISSESAKAADDLQKNFGDLWLIIQGMGQGIVGSLMEPLRSTAEYMTKLAESSHSAGVLGSTLGYIFKGLALVFADTEFILSSVVRSLGGFAAQVVAAAHWDWKGVHSISDAMKADTAQAMKDLDAYLVSLQTKAPGARAPVAPSGIKKIDTRPEAPGVAKDTSERDAAKADRDAEREAAKAERTAARAKSARERAAAKAASDQEKLDRDAQRALEKATKDYQDELRAGLDGQLKIIAKFGAEQQDAYKFDARMLDGVYADGLLSLRAYTDSQKALRADGLATALDAFDKERAAIETYLALPTTVGDDRIKHETALALVIGERASAVTHASQVDQLAAQQTARDLVGKKAQYDELRASILSMAGDAKAASQIRIDMQVTTAQVTTKQAGGDPALPGQLRVQLEGQQEVNQAVADYHALLEKTRVAMQAVAEESQQTGASEIDQAAAVTNVRDKSLAELQAMLDKARELAARLNTPASNALVASITATMADARLQVDQLRMSIQGALGESIVDMFKGTSGSILNIWANLLEKMVADMLAKKLMAALFGDSMTGASASGNSGWIGAGMQLIGAYFGSSSGGGVGGSDPNNYYSHNASGGTVDPFSVSQVNERGPELLQMGGREMLMMGSQGGRVVPNSLLGGGGSTNITFEIASGVSRNELAAMIPGMTARIKSELMQSMRRPGFQRN
jgi:hypothetical protein